MRTSSVRKSAVRRGCWLRGIGCALFFAAAGGPVALAQAECKPLFDANDKMLGTLHHVYITQTAQFTGGKARTIESITVGNVIYVQVKDKWVKSPLTVDAARQQEQENRKNAKNVSCKLLRDETVDGQAARAYSSHSETEDTKSDATTWVSKSSGMPLKMEQDLDVGGADGKSHETVRYEYTNVKAPAIP